MKKNKKIITNSCLIAFGIIVIILSIFLINTQFLMGNSTYNTITIKEKEKYTLPENYVSVCTSSDDSIVKARVTNSKCVLTGVSKGKTDVGLFIANKGITEISYDIVVNSSVKISKKFRIGLRSLIFNIDTSNINNINFRYCYVNNNQCSQHNINNNDSIVKSNNSIRFNNLGSNIKKVCLYAYDENKLVDSLCVDRGLFNFFW